MKKLLIIIFIVTSYNAFPDVKKELSCINSVYPYLIKKIGPLKIQKVIKDITDYLYLFYEEKESLLIIHGLVTKSGETYTPKINIFSFENNKERLLNPLSLMIKKNKDFSFYFLKDTTKKISHSTNLIKNKLLFKLTDAFKEWITSLPAHYRIRLKEKNNLINSRNNLSKETFKRKNDFFRLREELKGTWSIRFIKRWWLKKTINNLKDKIANKEKKIVDLTEKISDLKLEKKDYYKALDKCSIIRAFLPYIHEAQSKLYFLK